MRNCLWSWAVCWENKITYPLALTENSILNPTFILISIVSKGHSHAVNPPRRLRTKRWSRTGRLDSWPWAVAGNLRNTSSHETLIVRSLKWDFIWEIFATNNRNLIVANSWTDHHFDLLKNFPVYESHSGDFWEWYSTEFGDGSSKDSRQSEVPSWYICVNQNWLYHRTGERNLLKFRSNT